MAAESKIKNATNLKRTSGVQRTGVLCKIVLGNISSQISKISSKSVCVLRVRGQTPEPRAFLWQKFDKKYLVIYHYHKR